MSLVLHRSNASLVDDPCSSSSLALWWDNDFGNGISDWAIPETGVMCFRFRSMEHQSGNVACRRKKDTSSVADLGDRFVVSLRLYHETLGSFADINYAKIHVSNGDMLLNVAWSTDGLMIYDAATDWAEVGTDLTQEGRWEKWTFDVDLTGGASSATCDVYLDDVLQAANVACYYEADPVGQEYYEADGVCMMAVYGFTEDNNLTYVDWFKVGDAFILCGIKDSGLVWTKKYDEVNFADAKAVLEDLIDAALDVGEAFDGEALDVPEMLRAVLLMKVRGDNGTNNEWNYSFHMSFCASHVSTVNTIMKNNLSPVLTEWEDVITDSGKYNNVERVCGSISVIPQEIYALS